MSSQRKPHIKPIFSIFFPPSHSQILKTNQFHFEKENSLLVWNNSKNRKYFILLLLQSCPITLVVSTPMKGSYSNTHRHTLDGGFSLYFILVLNLTKSSKESENRGHYLVLKDKKNRGFASMGEMTCPRCQSQEQNEPASNCRPPFKSPPFKKGAYTQQIPSSLNSPGDTVIFSEQYHWFPKSLKF